MVEFGEELIIESFRIPWLIWIQVIVFLLLIILLYSFSLLTTSSDLLSTDHSSSPSSSSSSALHGNRSQKLEQRVGEISGEVDRSSGRSRRLNREDRNENKEGGSSVLMVDRSISTQSMYGNNHHPCNIVRLAKVAFLKCLGLDNSSSSSSSSSNPSITNHNKSSSSSREHRNER